MCLRFKFSTRQGSVFFSLKKKSNSLYPTVQAVELTGREGGGGFIKSDEGPKSVVFF
jgi:hypothetical protein